MSLVGERPEWQAQAECRGISPELFFPERGGDVSQAKKVCVRCPCRVECAEYAILAGEKLGVWGGLSERERRRRRRQYAETRILDLGMGITRRGPEPLPIASHGTRSGYRLHLKRSEIPCDPCRDAARALRAEYRDRTFGAL